MFWSTVSSLVGLPIIYSAMNRGPGGWDWAKRNGRTAFSIALIYYFMNFKALNHIKGFRNQDYLCHLYAKNHKMLRNILIKQ